MEIRTRNTGKGNNPDPLRFMQDPNPLFFHSGSNIKTEADLKSQSFSAADPDPGSGAFLTTGSGIRDEKKSRSRIRDEHPGSIFLNLVSVLWVKNT